MKDYILTIGNSMIDIYGSSSTCDEIKGCEKGSISISFGGVGRNIVENLLRISVPTKFISVFGNDFYGRAMKEQLINLNGDLHNSLTINKSSASFMGIKNKNKQLKHAIVDSSIMEYLTIDYLEKKRSIIENARYIVFDSNDNELFDQFFNVFQDVNVIIDPVSPIKAKKIKHLLPYFHTIKPNKQEAESLCGFKINDEKSLQKAGKYFIDKGIKNVFITLEDEGVYYHNGKEEGKVKTRNVTILNDVGAGDAFVSGICFGYLNQLCTLETVKFAYAMAILTLSTNDTVNQQIDLTKAKKIVSDSKWIVNTF